MNKKANKQCDVSNLPQVRKIKRRLLVELTPKQGAMLKRACQLIAMESDRRYSALSNQEPNAPLLAHGVLEALGLARKRVGMMLAYGEGRGEYPCEGCPEFDRMED